MSASGHIVLRVHAASLDPNIADKARKLLRRIQREQGIAMLYTSHHMRDVEEVCLPWRCSRQGKPETRGWGAIP